jgi:hypothetical protein
MNARLFAFVLLLVASPGLARTWDVEFAPAPSITASINSGGVPMRTRIDTIRLTSPVLRTDLAGAGAFWESRIECEGVGFDDFVSAHFAYRAQGVVRVPAARPGRRPIRAIAVYFHGFYGDPIFLKRIKFLPDAALEGDVLVGVPALRRGLAYASFNLGGWDDEGRFTTKMLEPAGFARPEDPSDWVDAKSGRLWAFSAAPLRKGDVTTPQATSVGRDVIRAAKQAVVVVADMAGLTDVGTAAPDNLAAVVAGHSFGGYNVSGIALGVNPVRPNVANGGNRVDPNNPASSPVFAGAIALAPSFGFQYVDPNMPLIPMMFINGESDPFFGAQFAIAARYGEVLAGRGFALGDRVSLWSLGNAAHNPPEVLAAYTDVRRGGDAWSPFVDAALGHMLRLFSADGDRRMPSSHYDGQRVGDQVLFPQVDAPPTALVPFVVDPHWDAFEPFGEFDAPEPLPLRWVEDFTRVAQALAPTGHLLGPRMANPIGGYRLNFEGAALASPFEDLGQRYGSWEAYLDRSQATIENLVQAGVYVAPRGKAELIERLDPSAFDAFAEQGLAGAR